MTRKSRKAKHLFPKGKQQKMKIIYCITALLLCGCASESFTTGTAQLSRESVNRNIVNGRTTKAQVRALLGEPQSQSTSDMGAAGFAECWVYKKTFFRDAADKGFGRAVLLGIANPYGTGYDRVEVSILLVTFDRSGRVTGHTLTNAAQGAPS
jgi:outer membrane protein assembly factor BamE (lipoprotein component of BamABCDE complex)